MANDKCIKITIDDVRIEKFHIWRETTPLGKSYYFKYKIELTDHEKKVITEKIKYKLKDTKLDFSGMTYDDTVFVSKFDGDLLIKSPIPRNGILISTDIKMIELPDVYSLYVRGIFSPSLLLKIETPNFIEKVTKFALYSLNETNGCIRFMRDEIYPDYFTHVGKDSVPVEEVGEFMKLY